MVDHKKEDDKRKKRIKDMLIHLHISRLNANIDVGAAVTEPKIAPKKLEKEQVNAAERLKHIRNRLDKSRRKAEDGWLNRASATGDEGARGRTL